jgi:hypothetical protein
MVPIDANGKRVMLPTLAAGGVVQTEGASICPTVRRMARNRFASMTKAFSRPGHWSKQVRLLGAALLLLSLPACSPLLSWRNSVVPGCETAMPAVCFQASGSPATDQASTGVQVTVSDPGIEPTKGTAQPTERVGDSPAPQAVQVPGPSEQDTQFPPLLPMPGRPASVPPDTLPRDLLAEPEPAPAPRNLSLPPPEANAPVLVALQAYLEGHTEQAIQLLSHYDDRDQQFLLRLFPILGQLERGGLHTAALTARDREVLLQALQGLTTDLRRQAPLRMRQLTFCRRVQNFGKFEPISANRFLPGQAVGVYCELENLEDQPLDTDRYCLTLAGEIAIHNVHGEPCWQQTIHFEPDISRSPRQDHFLFIRFRIPAELQEGAYRLLIQLRHEPTQRQCQGELPFQIVSSTRANP